MIFNFLKFLWLLAIVFLVDWSATQVNANWTPPSVAPYFCPTNEPACNVPLNATAGAQIKTGSLGVGDDITKVVNFFSPKASIGQGFVDTIISSPAPLTPTPVLDLDGQISIRGNASFPPGLNKVLTSDANGLASWQNYFWKLRATDLNDLYNTNTGKVGIGVASGATLPATFTINGEVGKLTSTILSSSATSTLVNLGNNSRTGVSSSEGLNSATISGGTNNEVLRSYGVISGGFNNMINAVGNGSWGVVAGGGGDLTSNNNRVIGNYGSVLGGYNNRANSYSLTPGGSSSHITGLNSFVWATSTASTTYSDNNTFLIFPNNSSPTSGRVGIGTPTPTAKLDVVGGIKTYNLSQAALDVTGPVKIKTGVTPVVGQVFVAKNLDGTGEWQNVTNDTGLSVMYLRRKCGKPPGNICLATDDPPPCPYTEFGVWNNLNLSPEYNGIYVNNVRVCYNSTNNCRVMELKSAISSPPNCPTGFIDAIGEIIELAPYPSSVWSGIDSLNTNNVRTCFKCFPNTS